MCAEAREPKTLTTTADWNDGTFFNTQGIDDDDDGALKLVDPGDVTTFPTLWPANAAEDTLTKFDTNLNKEVGRYRTWFDIGVHGVFSGPAPSRTAVFSSGDCVVVNRHFDGRPIAVMRVATSDDGAVDRNGNGVIDTAVDSNSDGVVTGGEIRPVVDDGGASAGAAGGIAGDGIPQIEEFHDERILWFVQIPGSSSGLGRSCAIDGNGFIWVGGYSSRAYWKLDPDTGAVVAGPIATTDFLQPYGAVVDSSGILYSASLGTRVGELDTNANTWTASYFTGISNYGIALDDARDRCYLGQASPYQVFDTVAKTGSVPVVPVSTGGNGISTAVGGDILVHGSNAFHPNFVANGGIAGSFRGCSRWRPDHSVVWSAAEQPGGADGGSRGIAPDANGDVFTVDLNSSTVSKFRGSDGTGLGVFPVGRNPYSYSDMTGTSLLQANLVGTWVQECADTLRGQKNCIVSWTKTGPGTVKVELAGSDTSGVPGPFTEATNGVVVLGVEGKYVTIRVTLQAEALETPCVEELVLDCCPQIGDFNDDCCVDLTDYNLLRAAYVARSTDPEWDVNGDGKLTITDLRREVVLFCNPDGSPCPPRP